MNNQLRKQANNVFEKHLFKLMNNSVFGKTMENVRKHKDIKLVTTDKRRNQLVSEPNYYTSIIIHHNYYTTIGFNVTLSTMIINKIQEFCIHLFQISHLVIY